ncbi:MAG: hypothetical protein HKN39_06765 [Flavobacteriales bacterium]|nr:hypothetical protein [Flavobacteriales bacterium]
MKRFVFCLFLFFTFLAEAQEFVPTSTIKFSDSIESLSTLQKWTLVNSVSIYGGGTLLSQVTSKSSEDNASSPSGSLGMNLTTEKIVFDIFYSYNSKQEVEMNDLNSFGNTLMSPDLGGQSVSMKASTWFTENFGLQGSLNIIDSNWNIDSLIIDASPTIARLGLAVRPFMIETDNNNVDLLFTVNYSHRAILGDFNNNTQTIGTQNIDKRGYNGFDFRANLILNSVKIYTQLSTNAKGDFDIPGFTGTQVLFGIDVTGEFIKLKG